MKKSGKKYLFWVYILSVCMLLSACANGGGTSSEDSTSFGAETTASNESSSDGSSEAVTGDVTTESTLAGNMPVLDKSILTDLLGDFIGGSKPSNGLVYDLEHDYFEYMRQVISQSGSDWDFYEAKKYPQVAIESADAEAFNLLMQKRAKFAGEAYDFIKNGEMELNDANLMILLDYIKEYEDYTVIESEEYLSIICGYCSKFAYDHDMDVEASMPEYAFDAYVFEKKSGRLLHNFDVVHLAESSGEIAVSDLVPSVEVFFDSIYPGNNYCLSLVLDGFWSMMSVMKMDDAFDPDLIKYESLYSNLLPAFYVGANGEVRLLAAATNYGALSKEILNSCRWYKGEVADVGFAELPATARVESDLYGAVKQMYGIETDALALVAYIGYADDLTLAKFQNFVDELGVSVDDFLPLNRLNYSDESVNYLRSVYIVIPKYKYAKVSVETGGDFLSGCVGAAVVCIDQSENMRIPVLVHYFQEGENMDALPYDYRASGEKLGYEYIYDMTEYLESPDIKASEIREEIEEFFRWVRTRG